MSFSPFPVRIHNGKDLWLLEILFMVMGGPNYFLCNAQQTENFLQMYKNGIWKPQEL